MKTAISIPDQVFDAAEALARQLGMSRSELYSRAVAAYLVQFQDEEVTRKLDQIYASESSSLEPALWNLQARSLSQEEW